MKIISILDSSRAYGKERANLEVVHIMHEQGADVKILINKIADKSIREELIGFQYHEIPFPRDIGGVLRWFKYIGAFILTQIYVWKFLRKEKPDYILVPTEIALTYLYIPLCLTNAKVVFRCGDSPLVFRKSGVATRIYGLLWKYVILVRVDTVVCNANFLQQQISMSGRKPNVHDTLIYNYPPAIVNKSDNVIFKKHPNTLRLGFMGRIVEDKGVRELLCAVRHINSKEEKVSAYICGDMTIDKSYADALLSMADDSMEFVGPIYDLEKFYNNIDIVAIPSIYAEPMANVLTEAKYHKKAVIIFNKGGMPEIVEHLRTGFVCKSVSVESLVQGIMFYVEHPESVKRMGESAFLSIQELGLTKDVYEKKWLKVFSQYEERA